MTDIELRTRTVSPNEAATRLGVAPGTLRNLRWKGGGPPYVKVGTRVRYRLSDLAEFLDENTMACTSDAGQ